MVHFEILGIDNSLSVFAKVPFSTDLSNHCPMNGRPQGPPVQRENLNYYNLRNSFQFPITF